MGQEPVLNYSPVEYQLYITKPRKLVEFLKLNQKSFEIKPAMMPRWTFKGTKKDIEDLSNEISKLLIDGKPCEYMLGENSLTIKIECINKIPILIYEGKRIDYKKIGLDIINVDDKSGSSAYHIPQGVLMIYGQNSENPRWNECDIDFHVPPNRFEFSTSNCQSLLEYTIAVFAEMKYSP